MFFDLFDPPKTRFPYFRNGGKKSQTAFRGRKTPKMPLLLGSNLGVVLRGFFDFWTPQIDPFLTPPQKWPFCPFWPFLDYLIKFWSLFLADFDQKMTIFDPFWPFFDQNDPNLRGGLGCKTVTHYFSVERWANFVSEIYPLFFYVHFDLKSTQVAVLTLFGLFWVILTLFPSMIRVN